MPRLNNEELFNVSGGQHDGFSKISKLKSKELKVLLDKGYVDESGFILKNNLEKAQEFLRESGWNGVLYIKGKDFNQLPEIINLSDVNDS